MNLSTFSREYVCLYALFGQNGYPQFGFDFHTTLNREQLNIEMQSKQNLCLLLSLFLAYYKKREKFVFYTKSGIIKLNIG